MLHSPRTEIRRRRLARYIPPPGVTFAVALIPGSQVLTVQLRSANHGTEYAIMPADPINAAMFRALDLLSLRLLARERDDPTRFAAQLARAGSVFEQGMALAERRAQERRP